MDPEFQRGRRLVHPQGLMRPQRPLLALPVGGQPFVVMVVVELNNNGCVEWVWERTYIK